MIGERVQDVQQQLQLNSTGVLIDEESQQMLEKWQEEQMNAYSMFETLLETSASIRTAAVQSAKSTALMKNKNTALVDEKGLAKFVERKYGATPRPLTASDRKLQRNNKSLHAVSTSFSGQFKNNGYGNDAMTSTIIDKDEDNDSPFELVLASKPLMPGQKIRMDDLSDHEVRQRLSMRLFFLV